jgi:hypothetical protein
MELAYICTKEAVVEMEKRDPKEVLHELLVKDHWPTDEHVVILRVEGSVWCKYKVVTGIVSIEEEEGEGEG